MQKKCRIWLLLSSFLILFYLNTYAQFEEFGLKDKYYDGRFIVYAPNYELARKVGEKIRSIYEKVVSDIGYSGAYKTNYQIFVWQDKKQYKDFLDKLNINISFDSSALAIYEFKGLPTIVGYLNDNFFNDNLPHEFTHLLLTELLGVKPNDIPLWLNEGLACYETKISLKNIHYFLKNNLEKGYFIKLKELLELNTYPTEEVLLKLFYMESHSLVSFLLEGQKHKGVFYSFLLWYVVKKYPFEKACLYAYQDTSNLKKIEELWLDYIKQH